MNGKLNNCREKISKKLICIRKKAKRCDSGSLYINLNFYSEGRSRKNTQISLNSN